MMYIQLHTSEKPPKKSVHLCRTISAKGIRIELLVILVAYFVNENRCSRRVDLTVAVGDILTNL